MGLALQKPSHLRQKELTIPPLSREDVAKLLTDPGYRPTTLAGICTRLKVRGGEKKKIRQYLSELVRRGEAIKLKSHRYASATVAKTVEGRLQYNRRGFAFVTPKEGKEDIYVPFESMGGAIHGDQVSVDIAQTVRGKGRPEGRVREVLERGVQTMVGQVRFRKDRSAYLACFGPDLPYPVSIATPLPEEFNPEEDPVVAVRINWDESEADLLYGALEAVLGSIDDPNIDSQMVIYRSDLPRTFPKDVADEARRIPDSISPSDLEGREDLRHLPFVTIDGADAKDFDDAIALDDKGDLWVAIADVSHYVLPDRPLDREAASRGNSFYFPDHVIPMLPEKLSNDLCSLRPNVDRLTLAAHLTISPEGSIKSARLFEAIIHSKARLTYAGVDRALSGKRGKDLPPDNLMPMLKKMLGVAKKTFKKRMSKGGIDFDLSETKVVLDQYGVVTAMDRRERTPAQQIVEEFMLAANKGVARFLHSKELPAIYRVHEKPEAQKLSDFLFLLRSYGYQVSLDPVTANPIELDQLLHRFDNDPRKKVFTYLALRSMKQAYYSPENLGHYGLGFSDYLHFTSPIRRYADLVVHRAVRAWLQDQKSKKPLYPKAYGTLEHVSTLISSQERVAQSAEREIRLLKGIRFLKERKGKSFPGMVTGMISAGLFVELEEHAVEGFVHLSRLHGDQFDFYDREKILRGRRKGKTIRLGDRVVVKVEEASLQEFRIDFSITSFGPSRPGQRKRS